MIKEGTLRTKDNLNLYTCVNNIPDPKAQLILIHGYTEHCRRYDELVEIFNELGFNVIRYDQRGYGRSEGRRAYVSKFQQYNDDLIHVINDNVDESLPLFMAGASMGGMVLARHLINEGDVNIGGAIFFSAMLKISDDISPMLQKISGLLGLFVPWLKTIKLDTKQLSRDPDVEKKYLEDPLIYKKGAYARTADEMLKSTKSIQGKLDKISCPLLILHGTSDKLTDPDGSKRLYEQAASEDKTLHLFNGFYHEICNEPEKEEVFQKIKEWLSSESRILGAPAGQLIS